MNVLFSSPLKTQVQRWLSGLLISLCLLLLAGCQTSSSRNNGVIQLTLWHGINPPPNRDVFETLVQQFNQTHKDVKINSIYTGQLDQQLPKILTAVVGNAPPDILAFNPQITGQFVNLDAIKPLETWLNQSPLKSELNPNLFKEMQWDKHIWSVPLYTSNVGIFYRPDLFKAAGITDVPKTWEELREVAKKLTVDRNGDGRPEQYGMLMPFGKGEWTVFTWFPFLLSAGGHIVQDNQPNLVNPGAVTALQFWQDLIKEGSATLSAPERGYEEGDFIDGRVAMQITGPWTFIMKSGVDYDVFPIPGTPAGRATVIGGGNLFVMKTTPAREQAALKFLAYVLSEDFQTPWSVGTGFLPVNIKSAKSQVFQTFATEKKGLKVFLDQMSVAGSRPIIPGYSRLSESLGRAIEAAMLGQSPQKALQTAQDRLELIWEN